MRRQHQVKVLAYMTFCLLILLSSGVLTSTISQTFSVLSMCEFSGKTALLIVNYSDSLDTDSTSLSGFSPVFEVAAIRRRKAFLPRPNTKERLEQLCESRYGNLYM